MGVMWELGGFGPVWVWFMGGRSAKNPDMSISPRFMQELRDRLSLSEIIGRRVKLVRAGHEYKACCPFHGEKSPSFYVNDDKQFFHCFGCGAHGDAVGFVMRHDNLSFIEAIEALAPQAGLEVPRQTREDVEHAKQEKDLHALMAATTKWFQDQLHSPAHRDALQYVRERGLPDDVLSAFSVGFAPADGGALPKFLREQGFSEKQILDSGVARKSTRNNDLYAFFRDRVIFPVPDRRGRVVAFGGRVLPEHLRPIDPSQSKPPKYINSSDSPLFHKGRMLFGEPHARQAAIDGKPLIVVEGYLDVIACWRAGFTGAVAPLGTALTEDQIAVLWKMIPGDMKVPVLCFDGDNAGRRAAARACERILPHLRPDHSARIAFLPEGEDPDSLIQTKGAVAFQTIIDTAMPLADFIWMSQTEGRSFNTPEERAGLERTWLDETARIVDKAVQDQYRKLLLKKSSNLFWELDRAKQNASRGPGMGRGFGRDMGPKAKGRKIELPPLRSPVVEKERRAHSILLLILLNHPWLFEEVEEQFGALSISDSRLDSLRQMMIRTLSEAPNLEKTPFYDHLSAYGFDKELQNLASDTMYVHAGFARPSAELQDVREGWVETIRSLYDQAERQELRVAGQTLAGDFSTENEQRILALHQARQDQDGQG